MAHAVDLRIRGGLVEWGRRLALWLPVLALAYPLLVWPLLEGPAPVANADLAPAVADTPSALNRLFFPPLLLAGLLTMALQLRVGAVNLARPAILLTGLYLAWATATLFWSVDPDVVLRRSLLQMTIVGAVMVPALAARDPQGLFNKLFWLYALVGLVNLGVVILNPPGPIGHEGIYAHKNTLGGVAAMVVLFALLRAISARGLMRFGAIAVTLVAVFLLVESRSKTSIGLSVLIPVAAYAVLIATRATRVSPALIVPAAFGALALVYWIGVQTYLWDFEAVATFIFGDPTLTQRTEIWDFALKMIERQPWLGYGYESFWGASYDSPSIREAPGFVAKMPHAHNGFLDLVIGTGFIGLAIVMGIVLALLHTAGQVARHSMPFGMVLLALTLSCIFYNLTETTWFRSFDLQHMIFLLTIGLACSARDLIEDRAHG